VTVEVLSYDKRYLWYPEVSTEKWRKTTSIPIEDMEHQDRHCLECAGKEGKARLVQLKPVLLKGWWGFEVHYECGHQKMLVVPRDERERKEFDASLRVAIEAVSQERFILRTLSG
jgi:hypothetical protein